MTEALPTSVRRWCLVAAAACALPLLLLVPGWFAGVLGLVWVVALLSERPLPAWLRLVVTLALGLLVLAAYDFRIGRDTSCAGLLAMLLLKPFETHGRRDAHSLLGFSLFAPFAAFLQDQGPVTLSLAFPAVGISLLAWSLLVPGRQRPLLPSLRQAGGALALAAPMALAGFWLFPRLAAPLWGLPENSVSRAGLGDRMTPNEWLDTLVDDSAAFRVRFIGRTPPRTQMYWRGPVLTQFDGEAWTRDPSARHLPAPRLQAGAATVRYELTLEPTERRDLLVLDLPDGAPEGSGLNGELTAVTAEPINNLVRYTGVSHPDARYEDGLRDWQRRGALALPPGRNPRTTALARRWAAETPDPLALTQRFMALVERDFKYSISVPPLGFHSTDEFLFDTRTGFCQHFSSAYAVFMRAAGVPTRVVTGYVGGHYNSIGDYWLLKHKDAHAWNEMWIEDRGWVRVDPTAAVAPDNILDTLDDLQLRQQEGGFAGAAAGMLRPVFDGSDFLRRQWNELVLGFNAARQQNLLRPFGIDEAEGWQLVLAFAVGSLLAALVTFWFLLRQHRDRSHPLVRAWRETTRRLGRAGWRKAPSEPPLAWARRLAAAAPGSGDDLIALSERYCDWRYAGASLTDEEQTRLIRGLRGIRMPRQDRSAKDHAMKTVHATALLAALALAGCASPPKPLQGTFSQITPEQAVQREGLGEVVRWGGRIVLVEPGSQNSCFEIVAAPLTVTGRPQTVDQSLGRFIACRAGFYDPEVFLAGREVTISGRVEGFETRKVGNYDYRYPRVAAEVVYLWPERRDVDVIVDPWYRGYYGGRGWGWGMGWGRRW